jgi:hypothetical protein
VTQIDMAFVDALERDKRAQKQEEQRPQPQIDDHTRPFCDKVGHQFEVGNRMCIFCGVVSGPR